MTEAETRIARTFRPRDWVPLTPAFIRIVSFVDGRADLALACINRDLLEGRLCAALVAPDGTIKMLLAASDWQRRTVHAPHNPAEGVRVEPYEEGRFFIWRADLDKEYPTNPATPAAATDRRLYAAGEPEPSQSPQAEQQLPPAAPDMDVPAPVTSATLPPAEGSLVPATSAALPVNPGGRPTDRDLVLEEAGWRLRHQQAPETLAAFARELREWLEDHGMHRAVKTGEVMQAETIEDHVRSMWNTHKRA